MYLEPLLKGHEEPVGGAGEEELCTTVFVDRMVDPAEFVLVNTEMLDGNGEGVTVETRVDDRSVVEPREFVVGIIMTLVDVYGELDDVVMEP